MTIIDAARQALPLWVNAMVWLWGPVLGLFGFVTMRLACGNPPPERAGVHWSESARELWAHRQPAMVARGVSPLVAMLACGALSSWVSPSAAHLLFTFECIVLGPFIAATRFEGLVYGRSARQMLRSRVAGGLGLFSALYLLPVFGVLRLGVSGPWAWVVSGLTVVVLVLASSGFGLFVASWFGLARPAGPKVRAAVDRAGGAKHVWELDVVSVNAFALQLTQQLAFSTPLVNELTDAELEAVAHHEIGHFRESLPRRLFRPVTLTVVACVALSGPAWPKLSLAAVLGVLAAVVGLLILVQVFVRRGEHIADAHAHANDDDRAYAKALEKMYRLNRMPAVLPRPGSHGHLYDRLTAAGQTPEWPRPALDSIFRIANRQQARHQE